MKPFLPFLLTIGALFLCFFEPSAKANQDYGVMSATPYNSEIAIGRERMEKFLYTANAKKRAILAQNPVVAVEAALVPAGETGPLFIRIKRGEFGIGNGGYPADQASREVVFVLLFDSRSGQMVSDDGVLVVTPPQRGKVGLFGGVSALYIGEGW
ncbi:MAG TPA: hypothetical protein VE154_00400 [Chthoniobacterales bacterium]|nr:hypothetical protein [Chthoniobacterales bacterium]